MNSELPSGAPLALPRPEQSIALLHTSARALDDETILYLTKGRTPFWVKAFLYGLAAVLPLLLFSISISFGIVMVLLAPIFVQIVIAKNEGGKALQLKVLEERLEKSHFSPVLIKRLLKSLDVDPHAKQGISKRLLQLHVQRLLRFENPVNINTASRAELRKIHGVGRVIANSIIERRPFTSLEQLLGLRGIGPVAFARLRDQFTLGGSDDV